MKNTFCFFPKDYWKSLVRKIITTVTITVAAGFTIWALAAFTEPTVGPGASDQDFSQNILGANNANNNFDSSLVTASSTGSIIERLEYLWANRASFMANVTNLDTTVSSRASATDYTSARATKIDNLDTTVSSRLAAASYTTERGTDSAALASNYTSTRAGYLDRLDATVSSRLAAASYVTERGTDSAALASNYTAARATKIDNLDATISSRAAAGDSKPGSWACVVRTASSESTNHVSVYCTGNEKAISGGCYNYSTASTHPAIFANYPLGQGWYCMYQYSTYISAYANCCQ